ncbi:50S ribosomal protein L28 [Candidatus Saccharibacteria bacterium]|nr:50S ribosomal protein L28 [Candidatus Saccharibacteria bacterium]
MSYKCDITGKGKQFGNNRSHSLRATKKAWKPNLQTKTLIIDGQKVRLKLAASTIRTLKKYQNEIDAKELAAVAAKETKKEA